jgi:hypothetical protein
VAVDRAARRRERPWWRSRRLVAAVVIVDLLGVAFLAYALAHHHNAPSSAGKRSGSGASALASRRSDGGSSKPVLRARPHVVEPAVGAEQGGNGAAAPNSSSGPRRAPATQVKVGAGSSTDALRAGARASFAHLQARLADEASISLAIRPLGLGSLQVLGTNAAMQGMSTTKILVLSALLRDRGGVSGLTSTQRTLAQSAITESDNQSILDLFGALENDRGGLDGASAYTTQLLRDAGDFSTTVATAPPPAGYATTFGQTPWRPSAEVTFFRSLARGCLLAPADTAYVLGLMGSIEPSESWGLGSAGFSHVVFKGGWGPEAGGAYGVRQTGIIDEDGNGVVVALAADPTTTFPVGTSVITQIAQWLRHEVILTSRPTTPCR